MTIFVAIKKLGNIAVCSDSQITTMDMAETNKDLKGGKWFWAHEDCLICVCGKTMHNLAMQKWFKKNPLSKPPENSLEVFDLMLKIRTWFIDSDFEKKSGSSIESCVEDNEIECLVISKSHIFRVTWSLYVHEYKRFVALGSGSAYAFGSYDALFRSKKSALEVAKECVRISCNRCIYCGGTIQVLINRPL